MPLSDNAASLARFFRVSTLVVARKAFDDKLITWPSFNEFYDKESHRVARAESGGNYYRTLPVRNGRRFTEAVLRSASEQRLLLREAASLLSANPSKLERLTQELRIA